METLSFVIFALLPPLISGPLPAILWFRMGRSQNWRWMLPLVAFFAIVLNIGAAALIVVNLEGFLPAGFLACALTPIAALATLLLSRLLVHRGSQSLPENTIQRRWLRVGIFAIPALQLFTVATLVLIAPSLCAMGIRSCTE